MPDKLREEDFVEAARTLRCDIPAIKAVAEVESRGNGFLADGRPTILYERHVFHRFAKRKPGYEVFARANADIASPRAGGYGAGGANQYERMDRARRFDEDAAFLAASWGKFQVMGFNFLAAGFRTVSDFVQAQYENELQHLMAFLGYVKFNGIDDELRRHDWVNFARLYNGADYKRNKYDEKLAAAYKKYN
jgi:hypothetical protein